MLPIAELKETLDRLDPSYALAIHQHNSALTIDTYVEMIDNSPQVLDTTCLSSFAGSIDEFAIPIAGVPIIKFQTGIAIATEAIATAISYGDYANRTGGDRGVLIQISGGYVTIYAVPQAAPNFYFRQQIKYSNSVSDTLDINEVELELVILGCHLSTLNLLLNDKNATVVDWQVTDRYLAFQIPLQSLDRYAYLKPIVNCFELVNLGDFQIGYTLPILRTIAAIKAQQPTKSNNRFLKIVDQVPTLPVESNVLTQAIPNQQLKVGKVGDLLDREWSVLEIFNRDCVNPLPRVTVNAPAFLKSVQMIERYARKHTLSQDLSLEFYSKTVGDRQRWIVRISFEDKSNLLNLPLILGSLNIEAT